MILIFLKNLQNQKNQSIILLDETQKVLNAVESGIFPKGKLGKGLLINLACVDGAACVALRP